MRRAHNFRDRAGERHGALVVRGLNPLRHRGSTRWDCVCDCGREVTVRIGDLSRQRSCGCAKRGPPALDLCGVRFGRLVALDRITGRGASGYWYSAWRCRCDCGTEREVLTVNLRKGRTVSCGCWNSEKGVRHGLSGTKEIGRWYASQRRARVSGGGGSHTVAEARALLERQRFRCAYCRGRISLRAKRCAPNRAELDHVTPISRGGSNALENLQWLCHPCNRSKHAMAPLVFARKLGLLL